MSTRKRKNDERERKNRLTDDMSKLANDNIASLEKASMAVAQSAKEMGIPNYTLETAGFTAAMIAANHFLARMKYPSEELIGGLLEHLVDTANSVTLSAHDCGTPQ